MRIFLAIKNNNQACLPGFPHRHTILNKSVVTLTDGPTAYHNFSDELKIHCIVNILSLSTILFLIIKFNGS
jgi:hypothetical protein